MRFKDRTGRDWTIGFTCDSVLTLERELGMKALDFAGVFWPAWCDLRSSVDMVWALVRDEAESRGVGMREFLDELDEDALHRAREALMEEYIRFFRSPTRRDLMRSLRSETERFAKVVEEGIVRRLTAMLTSGHGERPSPAPV